MEIGKRYRFFPESWFTSTALDNGKQADVTFTFIQLSFLCEGQA